MDGLKLDSLVSLSSMLSERIDALESSVQDIQRQIKSNKRDAMRENGEDTVMQLVQDISKLKTQVTELVRMSTMSPEMRKLKAWLEDKLKIPQYFDVFIRNGVEDLSIVALLDKQALESMGITAIG